MARSGTKSLGMSMTGKLRSHSPSVRAESAGSSRLAAHRERKEENYSVSRSSRRRGKTDWAIVDALTDEEIAEAVRNDPDAVPLDIDWSEAVVVIPPKKKAISIRVDEDVLDYFKKQGSGYQRRMNAVLRSYMQQSARQKRKKRA
jgi:uncharacterized protein (DUF4415 family)